MFKNNSSLAVAEHVMIYLRKGKVKWSYVFVDGDKATTKPPVAIGDTMGIPVLNWEKISNKWIIAGEKIDDKYVVQKSDDIKTLNLISAEGFEKEQKKILKEYKKKYT